MTTNSHAGRTLRGFAAAAAVAAVALAPAAAHAETYTGTPAPQVGSTDNAQVLGSSLNRGGTVGTASTGSVSAASQSGSLPVTGGDVASLALIGFGALGVGTVMVVKTRSRQVA